MEKVEKLLMNVRRTRDIGLLGRVRRAIVTGNFSHVFSSVNSTKPFRMNNNKGVLVRRSQRSPKKPGIAKKKSIGFSPKKPTSPPRSKRPRSPGGIKKSLSK